MPNQEYHCKSDGPFDIHLTFAEDVKKILPCPTCGADSHHVLRAPAGGAHFSRTWNEQANEARRDPYTQARTQIWNTYNEQRDMGVTMDKPTEAGIQTGAKGIYESERRPPVSEEVRVARQVRDAKKQKQES